MASIDAFHELAERLHPAKGVSRLLLHRLRPVEKLAFGWKAHRERGLILLAVGLWHVAMVLALRAAMQVPASPLRDAEVPLQITIIERHPVPLHREVVAVVPRSHSTSVQHGRSIPRTDALQAVAIETQPNVPEKAEPSKASIYQSDGALRLPVVQPPQSRDLLAHRSMSGMLPGDDHPLAPGVHVRPGLSPQKLVERVGMLFGGGPVDPCPELETDLVNTADPDAREQALERFERACPGR